MKWDKRMAEAIMLRRDGSIDYREMAARIEVVLNAMDAEGELVQLQALLDERGFIIYHLQQTENVGLAAGIVRSRIS